MTSLPVSPDLQASGIDVPLDLVGDIRGEKSNVLPDMNDVDKTLNSYSTSLINSNTNMYTSIMPSPSNHHLHNQHQNTPGYSGKH